MEQARQRKKMQEKRRQRQRRRERRARRAEAEGKCAPDGGGGEAKASAGEWKGPALTRSGSQRGAGYSDRFIPSRRGVNLQDNFALLPDSQ